MTAELTAPCRGRRTYCRKHRVARLPRRFSMIDHRQASNISAFRGVESSIIITLIEIFRAAQSKDATT